MNRKSKLLLILSAAAMGFAATSCKGDSSESGEDASSQNSVISAATRISHDELPYITIGDALNLDEYITIKYEDNSSDHTFSVTCANSAVSIDGHNVVATEAGTFSLLIKAGSLQAKISLQVVTEEHMELINFLAPLDENPQNFTIDLFASDYIYSAIHTENYIGIYDIYDPADKVKDDDGNETDEYNSTILAKLSDNHAYWGHIEGTAKNPVPVFEPGYASWNNYYITQDLSLDATDFEVTDLSDFGVEEALLSSTAFEDNFMSVGISRTESSLSEYGLTWAGMMFMGLQDNDEDGADDGAVFAALVNGELSDGSYGIGLFCYVQIRDIGTTKVDFLDKVADDASYIPAIPKADEVTTVFDQINEGKNYTVTLEMYSADDDGNPLATPASKDGMVTITGGLFYAKTVTTVTEEGIHSVLEAKKAEEADGKITVSELTKAGEIAYWTDGTNCYTSSLGKDGNMSAKEKIQEGKDVLSIEELKPWTAQNVTENEVNNTIWTKKTTDGTKVTMKGQCGDNDGTTATDLLFVALFDMSPFFKMGTYFGKAVEFTSGMAALISMSNYEEVTVDTATKDVTVFVNAYLPFSDINNKNMGMKLTISNVGTTTNDFSSLK
ncbi:MAG TPA: hypothetical protein DD384_03765 [Firmicutes bacterium]|nr:hypothetical protein [Bacillota bacterium]